MRFKEAKAEDRKQVNYKRQGYQLLKRREAEKRHENRNQRTAAQQIKKLDLGGHKAVRERTRLLQGGEL